MLDLYKFKQRIKERCAQTGVSQSFLCEKVGRQRTYLNNIWRGATTPSDNDLKQFAELLSTTPAYLRGETDDPDAPHIVFKVVPDIKSTHYDLDASVSLENAKIMNHLFTIQRNVQDDSEKAKIIERISSLDTATLLKLEKILDMILEEK